MPIHDPFNAQVPDDVPIHPVQAWVNLVPQFMPFEIVGGTSTLNLADSGVTDIDPEHIYRWAKAVSIVLPDNPPAIYLSGNEINDPAAIDAILVALTTSQGGVSIHDGTIDLSGPLMATPTGTGLAAKATLEGRGWTVTVNS